MARTHERVVSPVHQEIHSGYSELQNSKSGHRPQLIMLISHEHQFLFVHIPKTAGSSIQNALTPFASEMPKDRWSRIRSKMGWIKSPQEFYLPKHATYCYAEERLGSELYQKMFKFSFVRNPWDLLVSYYSYIQKNTAHHRHQQIAAMKDFEEYVDYEIARNKASQWSVIFDPSGQMKIDHLGRFETLEKDFLQICAKIGIKASLPHVNASRHRSYQDFYTPELRDKVARHWAKDIDLLGYSFEGTQVS